MNFNFNFPSLLCVDKPIVVSRISHESESGYSSSRSSSITRRSRRLSGSESIEITCKRERSPVRAIQEEPAPQAFSTYCDTVHQLRTSSPPPSRPAVSKPRRKSDFVDNTNSIVLVDKKKLVRRKSVYLEAATALHTPVEPVTFDATNSSIRRSRRLSMSTEWNAKNPRRSRRISTYIERNPQPLSAPFQAAPAAATMASRSKSKRNAAKRPKIAAATATVPRATSRGRIVQEVIEDIWFVSLKTINKQSIMQFYVKWDGHPISENTYEPLEHIRHCDVLAEYVKRKFSHHQEQIDELCARLLSESNDIQESFSTRAKSAVMKTLKDFDEIEYKCMLLAYIYTYSGEVLLSFLRKLRYKNVVYRYYVKWKEELESNASTIELIMKSENFSFSVTSENFIDFDPIPKFIYLSRVHYPENKSVMNVGCKCKRKCGKESPYCCPRSKGWDFVYSEVDGRLSTKDIQMIVECNDFCSCNINCPNRKKPITVNLLIFKTKNRGWGVRACENIPSGTFIMEYTGEFLGKAEAAKRARKYHETGNTYMFDLDYNDKGTANYSVDATFRGNLSRFINHSCNPNLHTWPATTCNEDPTMHKLYYFSQRFIRAGEELTIDYTGGRQKASEEVANSECFCGSASCKGLIF